MTDINLLNPTDFQKAYIHQLRQTIKAYNSPQIVLTEALQNAIDAVAEAAGVKHQIDVKIDFDERRIEVQDDGIGFPNDPKLLFLGGGNKKGNKRLFGLIGVGIKVVLFSSKVFSIRSRCRDQSTVNFEIKDAYRFENEPPPELVVPQSFEADPSPMESIGTNLKYEFPEGSHPDVVQLFLRELVDTCLPQGVNKGFGKTLSKAVQTGVFPNRFSGLLASYLRRFSYVGDVLCLVGDKETLRNTVVAFKIKAESAEAGLDDDVRELFDNKQEVEFEIPLEYLLVETTVQWVPPQDKVGIFHIELGPGGSNVTRVFRGFNTTLYAGEEDYEKLLTRKRQDLPDTIDEYRKKLFPSINGIILTLGRIPLFDEFLPGGSRRVLSANGVVTEHDLDLTRGRNQEYVRCFDLIIDLDAQLNYGKSQITDRHLVGRARRFVNDVYLATVQNAAGNWVGKIDTDEEDKLDVFLGRDDLGIEGLVLRKVPRDENDVIALFFELAGRGNLEGYRIFGLSQVDKYDARGIVKRIGDAKQPPDPTDERHATVVEFKVKASMLIKELERGTKSANEIDLLVAWDEGKSDSDHYGFADIEHSKFYRSKCFPHVQRYLVDTKTGAQIQVLLLKPEVESIKRT